MDSFLGQCFLVASPDGASSLVGDGGGPRLETMTLVGRKGKRSEKVPGEIKIYVETYDDLMTI